MPVGVDGGHDLVSVARGVRGFMPDDEGITLHRAARIGAAIGPLVEIGSYCGRSTVWLGTAAREGGRGLLHRRPPRRRPGRLRDLLPGPRLGHLRRGAGSGLRLAAGAPPDGRGLVRATAPAAVAAVAALAAALSACGGSGSGNRHAGGATSPGDATSSTVVAAPVVAAVEGLCVARSQVERDAKSVRGTFYDRSHEALHTIARQLDPVDRGLAARLLEAKEAVEVDVNAQPPAPALAVDLDHLIDAARQGLARLSIPFAGCR